MFNSWQMWSDFKKSFHQLIRRKILYVHTTKICNTPAHTFPHYLVKVENPKMLLTLAASSTNC